MGHAVRLLLGVWQGLMCVMHEVGCIMGCGGRVPRHIRTETGKARGLKVSMSTTEVFSIMSLAQ